MKQNEGPSDDPKNNPKNYEMNEEQWSFMYLHYPKFCLAPYKTMNRLLEKARKWERENKNN